jgi:hypothetical protein
MSSGVVFGYGIIFFYAGFQIMNDRLMCMYIKKQEFNTVLFIFKNFLHYMIPVVYITVMIMFVLPFIGDGPIFPMMLKLFFYNSCNSYWWTNVLLISNFVPWNLEDMCASNIAMISNEFMLIVILIPLFGLIYKRCFQRTLWITFIVIGLGGSMFPVIYMTIKYGIEGYPGFLSNSYAYMYLKLYYAIPPFLIGIA